MQTRLTISIRDYSQINWASSMKYKIALVTNESLHHKYWVVELYEKLDICLIIHPRNKISSYSHLERLRKKKIFQYGFFYGCLKILSLIYNQLFSVSRDRQLKKLSVQKFHGYEEKYNRIPKEKLYFTNSVNTESCIKKIKNNEIDFIFFLGGDIAKRDFISSPRVKTLNFHSGISPFYNGNKTNFHAFINRDFHLIGGTLMYMNEKIDGGRIIAHTLPRISRHDKAASIFYRNIKMAVRVYVDFIQKVSSIKKLPVGIEQEYTHKYLKNIDWSIREDIKLYFHEKKGIPSSHLRDSIILNYFNNEQKISNLFLRNS